MREKYDCTKLQYVIFKLSFIVLFFRYEVYKMFIRMKNWLNARIDYYYL